MVDVHCHLDSQAFAQDLPGVVRRAVQRGVKLLVTVGVNLESARRSLEIAEEFPEVYVALGVHPHYAKEADEETYRHLEELTHHPKVRAIGETGLDLFRNLSPPEVQEEAFRRQISLAKERGLPMVIHCREASSEVLRILEEEGTPEAGGMIHCFSGDWTLARAFLDRGFHLSFSGVITYPGVEELREVLRKVPLDRLLSETDAPFLAPGPHRGKRNEPAFVEETVKAMASIKGENLEEMERVTEDNASALFGF